MSDRRPHQSHLGTVALQEDYRASDTKVTFCPPHVGIEPGLIPQKIAMESYS